MEYKDTVTLKDGRACIIRNGTASDGQALLDVFNLTHEQTDFLLTYPEEHRYTAQQEADFLQEKSDSIVEIELLAELDGKHCGPDERVSQVRAGRQTLFRILRRHLHPISYRNENFGILWTHHSGY